MHQSSALLPPFHTSYLTSSLIGQVPWPNMETTALRKPMKNAVLFNGIFRESPYRLRPSWFTTSELSTCNWQRSTSYKQGSFLHEHARPLNKRCAWRLTTGFAFIKMARLKAIIAIILLVGLGECARDLTKCVVCKKTLTWS